MAGADGWTLTDLFENIYLRTAGADMYDQLARHEIPWTDPTVVNALDRMKTVIGTGANIAGGARGALQQANPQAVQQLFTSPPKAGMYFEGDFVLTNITQETDAEPGQYGVFTFPSVNGSAPAVVGAGDFAVMFKDSPAAQAFITFLTTPEAAEAWASRGGFLSANKNLDRGRLPGRHHPADRNRPGRGGDLPLRPVGPDAAGVRRDGGRRAMWTILQDYLANPGDPQAVAQKLEQAAARAD